MWRKAMAIAAALAGAVSASAAEIPEAMKAADVVFLGEVHDNRFAHEIQAGMVAALQPKALVFEMLTADQAAKATAAVRGDMAALGAALQWDEGGWPDFAMYYPIFAAAPGAAIYGAAVPRAEARAAMEVGVAVSFGAEAGDYGLTQSLSEVEQAAREQFQHEAHCEALPEEMLPVMVELQRLRDAALARAAKQALDETGGPVVVITGNGHARKDWGAPVYLRRVSDANVFSLGIAELSEGAGDFDALDLVPEVAREDPCAVFRKN